MKRKAFVQIPIMIGFVLMAVALPVASKLVKNNQDTRNKAAHGCTAGYVSNCIFMNADCTTRNTCDTKPVATATVKPVATAVPTNKICEEGMKDWCIYRYANCREENRCGVTPTRPVATATIRPIITPTSIPNGVCIQDGACRVAGKSCCHSTQIVDTSVCSQGSRCVSANITPTKDPNRKCTPIGQCKLETEPCCSGTISFTDNSCPSKVRCIKDSSITPTKFVPTPGGSYKLSMTYNCGSQGCSWNQKAQQWVVEGDPYKTRIVCVDDSSCKFVPTPTSYPQKTCVQWKLDSSGKCIGYEIKLYYTQAEGVVCERDYASNCNINDPTKTIIPTIKISPTSTANKNPTPTKKAGKVIGMCETGVDYDHNGVTNSLDMLKCFLNN